MALQARLALQLIIRRQPAQPVHLVAHLRRGNVADLPRPGIQRMHIRGQRRNSSSRAFPAAASLRFPSTGMDRAPSRCASSSGCELNHVCQGNLMSAPSPPQSQTQSASRSIAAAPASSYPEIAHKEPVTGQNTRSPPGRRHKRRSAEWHPERPGAAGHSDSAAPAPHPESPAGQPRNTPVFPASQPPSPARFNGTRAPFSHQSEIAGSNSAQPAPARGNRRRRATGRAP